MSSLKKEFSTETKGSEAGKAFIGRKVRAGRHAGRLRGRVTLWEWQELLIWGQFCGFLLANHLALSCFVPKLGLTQGPPNVPARLLAKICSSARVSGRLAGHITG